MSNVKISQLPEFTGNTSGSYLVMNDASQTTTYKVKKENYIFPYNGNAIITGSITTNNDISVNGINIGTGSNTLTGQNIGSTAVGTSALSSNLKGIRNTAIGYYALKFNTTGSHNVSLGTYALSQNISGSNNIAVGENSLGANTNGNNNIAIGLNAGSYETGSNNFYLDNINRASYSDAISSSLIYGTFNTNASGQTLNINAQTKISQDFSVKGYSNFTNIYVGSSAFTGEGSVIYPGSLYLYKSTGSLFNRLELDINPSEQGFPNGKAALWTLDPLGYGQKLIEFPIASNWDSGSIDINQKTKINGNLIANAGVQSDTFIPINSGVDFAFYGVNNDILLSPKSNSSNGVVKIQGSTNISQVMNLAKQSALPTGTTGSLAVSGSHLYFHNGTSWNQVI
jgi:hypothetical protein